MINNNEDGKRQPHDDDNRRDRDLVGSFSLTELGARRGSNCRNSPQEKLPRWCNIMAQ